MQGLAARGTDGSPNGLTLNGVQSPVRRPPTWDGHLLLLYGTEAQRRAGVGAWIRRGLAVDAKIYYTQRPLPDTDERSLVRLLVDVPEAGAALDRGQIEVVSALDPSAYDLGRSGAEVDGALAEGYSSVRWSGEVQTAWWTMSPDEHHRLERTVETLCLTRPVDVLCQYPADDSVGILRHLAGIHGGGVRDTLFHATPVADGLALAGEVDASNRDVLLALLAGTTSAAAPTTFRLDLHDLAFLDVGGARALLDGTSHYRARGGTVRLESLQPHVDRVWQVFGLTDQDGVLVEETP